ncbi:hypothetical protein PHLCEN_2v4960 [Hermanssonia centrifuga]|uniref:Uncharacterized protein n=1 Tax=Hermanssonia centrifuga TaxID=98765 RepID=A0A2R6PCD5_9APHY|nr:hypothetical protein PHLCEN_2v4960 [Hermanssonia centrifuga]
MSFFNNSTSSTQLDPAQATRKDIEVSNPPSDSISSLAFSPQADYLAASSWDNNDGTKVFSGGTDNAGRVFDLATGQSQQVAQHDAPIKVVKWIEIPGAGSILVTGSWDKTLKALMARLASGTRILAHVSRADVLPAFDPAPGSISATCFNRTGSILAYAVSYDWSKGHQGMTPGYPNKIMLHACTDDEVKRKAPLK